MQVELSKLEDVKFSIVKPPPFQKYFALYGPIRTDTAMLLINLLILPIRHTYSEIQTAIWTMSYFGIRLYTVWLD